MEMNTFRNFLMQKYRSALSFVQLIKTHRIILLSVLRNYITFFIGSKVVRIFPFFFGKLKLGENVRIQRLSTIKVVGADSRIALGSNSIVYENAVLEAVGHGEIIIGECGVLGDCRISALRSIEIGKRALVSWNVLIQDYDSHPLDPDIRAEQVKRICRRFLPRFCSSVPSENPGILSTWKPNTAPIRIGDDVWLGAGSMILKGACIGDGCTVACGSVVTSGVYPPGSVLAGNPAKVVKTVHEREVIA